MEKNYTKEELKSKRLDELKNISRNLNLKVTGRKEELIERILENQVTYFDILPLDINRIINRYQIENDINRKILQYLLFETYSIIDMLSYRGIPHLERKITELNNLFKKYNLDVQMVPREKSTNIDPRYKRMPTAYVVEWGDVGLVSDEVILNMLPLFISDEPEDINENLSKLGSKFRIGSRIGLRYEVTEISAK